jgi:hypothetical protein
MSKEHILSELEKFHQGKLDEVRAKRAGRSQPTTAQEIVTGGSVNIKIDAAHQQLVVSWGGK